MSILALRPELARKFGEFTGAFGADGSVSQAVLDACQQRVRWVHGLGTPSQPERNDADDFGAALKIAELMPYGHHDISDADVTALVEHFGEAGAVNLLTSIAMFDAMTRMQLVLGDHDDKEG